MASAVDLSYLSDTVVLLRFFEAAGRIRRAISVMKKRTGPHEDTIREFRIHSTGIRVGPPLEEFRGVLTGVPTFAGKQCLAVGGSRGQCGSVTALFSSWPRSAEMAKSQPAFCRRWGPSRCSARTFPPWSWVGSSLLCRRDRGSAAEFGPPRPRGVDQAATPWSDLPFILLTYRGGEPNAHITDMLGNVTALERPFHPTTLVNAVRSGGARPAAAARGRDLFGGTSANRGATVLLIRELHHRVKNTLATVQGLLGATARSTTSVDEFYHSFANRIVSLAKTHTLLTEGYWQTASLHEMLGTNSGRTTTTMGSASSSPDRRWSCRPTSRCRPGWRCTN